MTYPCTAGCNPPPCPAGYPDQYGSFGCDGNEACDPGNPLATAPCSTCCRSCLAPVDANGVPTAMPIWLNCASPGATQQTGGGGNDDLLLAAAAALAIGGVIYAGRRRH